MRLGCFYHPDGVSILIGVVRRTRAEMQEHNRARVLAAARAEFGERGFRDTTIDQIAERAELTRGAVYSNFPSKRALYFAVLGQAAEEAGEPAYRPTARTPGAALADFARAWLARLPLTTEDRASPPRLGRDLLPEIVADERVSLPHAQLTGLSAVVLGLCLERLQPPKRAATRMVRAAEVALTALHGAGQLAGAAPGFGEPFDVVRACELLAKADLGDAWDALHVAYVAPARPADAPWEPVPVTDALREEPAEVGDGVVAVLGLHRLVAVEEALRAAPPGETVTLAVVTGRPDELGPLARLVVTDLRGHLRAAVPAPAWPRLRIVHDEPGALARAVGVTDPGDATEAAVRIRGGRIVARASGFGAGHAAAAA